MVGDDDNDDDDGIITKRQRQSVMLSTPTHSNRLLRGYVFLSEFPSFEVCLFQSRSSIGSIILYSSNWGHLDHENNTHVKKEKKLRAKKTKNKTQTHNGIISVLHAVYRRFFIIFVQIFFDVIRLNKCIRKLRKVCTLRTLKNLQKHSLNNKHKQITDKS